MGGLALLPRRPPRAGNRGVLEPLRLKDDLRLSCLKVLAKGGVSCLEKAVSYYPL